MITDIIISEFRGYLTKTIEEASDFGFFHHHLAKVALQQALDKFEEIVKKAEQDETTNP